MVTAWVLVCALAVPASAPARVQAPPRPKPPVAGQTATPSTPVSVTVATDAQAAQPTDDRPITHVFQNLGKDLRALGSLETGAVLIIGGGSAVLAHQRDASIAAWVQRQPAASYPGVGNTIGNEFTQAGGALAVWTLGTAAGSDELAHVGSDLIRAQVLDGLLTTAIKLAVDRRRPDGGSYSFPSGHTSGTFARPPTPNRKML